MRGAFGVLDVLGAVRGQHEGRAEYAGYIGRRVRGAG